MIKMKFLILLLFLTNIGYSQELPKKVDDKNIKTNLEYILERIRNLPSSVGDYIPLSATFGGDVSGTYGAIVVADDSHNHGDATVANNITLTNITQITNRSHLNLTNTGTLTHAELETQLTSIAVDTTTISGNVSTNATDIDNLETSTATLAANKLDKDGDGSQLTNIALVSGVFQLDNDGNILPDDIINEDGLFIVIDGNIEPKE